MPHKRSMRSVEAVEDVVEAEEVATDVEAAAEVNPAADKMPSNLGEPVEANNPNTRVPSTLTSLLESGVDVLCISDGGGGHFSVLSPAPVHGRTSSPPSQTTSETGASSSLK